LIIVIVTDEEFDSILGEEILEFSIGVGFCTFSITLAIVKVFPDPVTPKRT
jgi:hypothetical protein